LTHLRKTANYTSSTASGYSNRIICSKRRAKNLFENAPSTAASSGSDARAAAATSTADDQRLHQQQFSRVSHASKRPLHGGHNLPA
jgi:hypothetical protein